MINTLIQVFPLILFFLIGYLFKIRFKYSEEMGQIITRIILYITLPVTIFLSFVSNTKNLGAAIYLPIVALFIQLTLFSLTYFIAKKKNLDKKTECVFITGPLISNIMLFLSPYFYLAYGDLGITRLALYDLGNSITMYFVAQTLFMSYGDKRFNFRTGFKSLLTSVPIWALITGLLIGGVGLTVPEAVIKPFKVIREVNTFLPMFVIGFYFKPILENMKLIFSEIFLKMVLGLFMGIGFSLLFLGNMDRITIILAASAPVGVVSLVFASIYDKDTKFASNLVSYSIVVGIFILTVSNYVFKLLGWSY